MKMSIGAAIQGNSFEISAASDRKSFSDALSLAATMVRDPGFRADGEESLQKFGEAFYRDYAANPSAK